MTAASCVGGTAVFVAEEISPSTSANFEVSLTWSCPTPSAGEIITPPQAYIFSADDLDCPGDWPQQFIFRPVPSSNPIQLVVETLGNPQDRLTIPLEETENGEFDFSYEYWDFSLQGTLKSFSPTIGAEVDIELLTWDGESVCSTGLYTFSAE